MTFDWWTFALQAINFLVLVWLLQRFLYRPVAGIIEKRRQQAEQVLQQAEQAKADAEATQKSYEQRIAALDEERQRVLDKAHEQIGKERRAAMDETREETEKMVAEAKEGIEKEKTEALKALRHQITDIAADMAAKLLEKAAPNVPNEAFLNAICERIDALPDKERDRLHRALAADDAVVTVVTAQPLDRAGKANWRKKLGEALEEDARTEFESDASLIGGAELRFPDAVLRASWNDELKQVKQLFERDSEPS